MTQRYGLGDEATRYLEAARRVALDVLRPNAGRTDAEARFPKENIDALRSAGLLNLVSATDVGGQGQGMRVAMAVADQLARECPSTAMIYIMHNCSTAVVESFGSESMRRELASGKLATLAFSEFGSRSHFWAPVSTATRHANGVELNAKKQLITAAGHCDVYVWSSKPVEKEGASSIWWVPAQTPGLKVGDPYAGLGFRGNSSSPILAEGVTIAESQSLGGDGNGFDVMMGTVLPWFNLQNAAVSTGLMEGALERTVAHVSGGTYDYSGARIADFPQVRGYVARMRTKTDMVRALLVDAISAIEGGREDATLRVLQS
ncbi:MAG: acyl-CoA/acyl-ACP dehydrogenase, partial [Myxococcales bacterium]|nr:acyl-CoA/acyl-ACP dehydrogenase [Myxococcales bacterium]